MEGHAAGTQHRAGDGLRRLIGWLPSIPNVVDVSDDGESGQPGRRARVERSRPVGPVAHRLRAAGRLLVIVAGFAVFTSAVLTVTGLYHHVDSGRHDRDAVAATADVGACRRTGPIAWDALGYWWKCKVLVRTADGRVFLTTVDRSMVTPDDVGRPVRFVEVCNTYRDTCRYGRPEGGEFFPVFAFLTMMHVLVGCVLLVPALIALADAVRGPRRTTGAAARPAGVRRAAASRDADIDIAALLKAHAPPAPSRPPWARDVTNG